MTQPLDATSSRRRVLSAVAVGTTALLAGLVACGSGDDGALKPSRPTTTAVGSFGVTDTQRDFHLSFTIDHPGSVIRVLEVQALTSPNVKYLGAVTVWPRDLPGENMGFGPKYPPPAAKRVHQLNEEIPAAETVVVPAPFTEPPAVHVVTGFRLIDGDIGATNGVRVSYEVDGKQSSETWTVAAIACRKPTGCKGPAGSDDPGFEDRVLRAAGLLPKD